MKRTRKIANFFSIAVMCALIICNTISCAFAAMNVPVKVVCDSGITLQDTDTFAISYYNIDDDTQKMTTVQISAKSAAPVAVEDGLYRIKSITYNGTNSTISSAFGVSGDFSAYSDINETTPITLTIGSNSCKELEGNYDANQADGTYNIIMDANHDENGQPKDGYTPGLENEIIPDEPEDGKGNVQNDEQDEDTGSSDSLEDLDKEILGDEGGSQSSSGQTQAAGSGEVVVEHYEDVDDQDGEDHVASSVLSRLTPLIIIFVVVMVGVYIAHKKKII